MINQDIHEIIDRSKKAANYLRLLTHARSCRGACGNVQCRNTFGLLRHTIVCAHTIVTCCCPVKGCHTTKRLLAHVVECSRESRLSAHPKSCIICTMAAEPPDTSRSVGSDTGMDVDEPEPKTPRGRDQSSSSDEEEDEEEEDESLRYTRATTLPIKTHVPSFHSPAVASSSSSSEQFVVPSIPKRLRSPGLEIDSPQQCSANTTPTHGDSPIVTPIPVSPSREPDKYRCTGEIDSRQGIRTSPGSR